MYVIRGYPLERKILQHPTKILSGFVITEIAIHSKKVKLQPTITVLRIICGYNEYVL